MPSPSPRSAPRPDGLALGDARRGMQLAVAEGLLWAIMFGLAEVYFVADAIRLGSTPLQLALVVSLPLALGGCASLLSARLLQRGRRRRPLVVAGVAVQALVLAGLAVVARLDQNSPWLLLAAVCAYHGAAQFVASPWSSWFGDLVPAPIRGRYFSNRSRMVHIVSFAALVCGGLVLQALERDAPGAMAVVPGGTGFAWLYGIASVARIGSASLLALSPEPRPLVEPFDPRAAPPWLAEPLHVALLPRVGLFFVAVYLSSPFFTPYMLEELELEYLEFTAASAAAVLAKVFYLRAWGRSIDRHGAASVYRLGVVLVALAPLPWIITHDLLFVLAAQALSGFSWAAHEVSLFSLLLETSRPEQRVRLYAVQSFLNGVGQLAGGLLGGVMMTLAGQNYAALFLVSAGLRGVVAVSLAATVRDVKVRHPIEAAHLLMRVMGLRVHGGIAHRPLPTQPADRRR